ncbi:hypothetical protein ES706_00264 [subsurface metagenome]
MLKRRRKSSLHGGLNLARVKSVEKMALLGPAAFYIGLLIVLVTAFVTPSRELFTVLAVLGVIVGLLNITARESSPFLLATIAFVVTALGMQMMITFTGVTIPTELTRLAANVTTLVGAAAMVIALRAIYEAAKGK